MSTQITKLTPPQNSKLILHRLYVCSDIKKNKCMMIQSTNMDIIYNTINVADDDYDCDVYFEFYYLKKSTIRAILSMLNELNISFGKTGIYKINNNIYYNMSDVDMEYFIDSLKKIISSLSMRNVDGKLCANLDIKYLKKPAIKKMQTIDYATPGSIIIPENGNIFKISFV